jgi:Spy/CpxP family protein refolding chaperone
MSKFVIITMAAALTAGGPLLLNAHGADFKSPQGPLGSQFLERAKEKLGLTDDQLAQIKQQLAGEKETLKSLLTRLQEARTNLRSVIHSPDSNESLVRAASAKVAAVEADLAVERFKLFGKISPILNPDQLEKLKALQSRIDEFIDVAINRIGERLTGP